MWTMMRSATPFTDAIQANDGGPAQFRSNCAGRGSTWIQPMQRRRKRHGARSELLGQRFSWLRPGTNKAFSRIQTTSLSSENISLTAKTEPAVKNVGPFERDKPSLCMYFPPLFTISRISTKACGWIPFLSVLNLCLHASQDSFCFNLTTCKCRIAPLDLMDP